ncbi:MAG: histidine kinase dimerization/phosphoacceptor domain -containing protein, partial [Verrucomicrobiota bacterium]
MDKLPAGAYTCAPDGLITYFNQHAVDLWGRAPLLNNPADRFCGSHKLFAKGGLPIVHEQCWMALALQNEKEYNGGEIIIQQPGGRRLTVLAYANPIRDEFGKLSGAVNVLVDVSELKASQEREALLRQEIHHRVKNNLQVISSLLYLQSIYFSDLRSREMMRESQSRIQSIALVHESLYQSSGLSKIELEPYIRKLAADLFDSYRISPANVAITIHAEGMFLDLDTAIPCGLIITELISNALKYAFPEGRTGTINIDVTLVEDAGFCLRVRDNGVGLPAGFSIREASTLGTRLVQDLTLHLNLDLIRVSG